MSERIKNSPGLVDKALEAATKAHKDQFRKDGTPFITHPIAVKEILSSEWGIDNPEILAAGLLHDTVEDNPDFTLRTIETKFGKKVADWVDGVTKFPSESREVADRETKKKVLDRGHLDPIVDILKLADRLHNMRTMDAMPPEKQKEKSQETLNVYAPIAESLGMWKVKTELEDLSLKYLDHETFEIYSNEVKNDERTQKNFTANMISQIEQALRNIGIDAQVYTRFNSLVRFKNKRERDHKEDISDMISFRVVVNELGTTALYSCYTILGELRNHFKGLEDLSRFSDAYSSPHDNGYSAMHMIINTHAGAVEIAITSKEKEDFNDWGILTLIRKGEENLANYSLKLIFTPTGKAKILAPRATGVDFAYSITDDFGNLAESIMINGETFPITTVIPHGSSVKVELGEVGTGPRLGIENYAQPPAKKRIDGQRRLEVRQSEEKRGKEMVQQIVADIGLIDLGDLFEFTKTKVKLKNFLYHLGCKGELSNLYYQIGTGKMKVDYFKSELKDREFTKENLQLSSILLEGLDMPGLLQFFAAKVAEMGCNIIFNQGLGGDEYTQRFVVNILSTSQKQKLTDVFGNDSRIKKVTIV